MHCTNTWFSSRLAPLCTTALAAITIFVAAPAFSDRGSSGGSSTSDTLASLRAVNSKLFDVPGTPTALTKQWVNASFGAMGNPDKLPGVLRTEVICDLVGPFGKMNFNVTASGAGDVRFVHTIESTDATAPRRRTTYVLTPNSNVVYVDDGSGQKRCELPQTQVDTFRRIGDIWNPLLLAMGQFEQVDSTTTQTVGARTYTVLTMGKPKIDGLTAGKVYLDSATALPMMVETTVTRDIPISGKYTITSWNSIAGIQVPATATVEGPDGTCTLTFTKIALYTSSGAL